MVDDLAADRARKLGLQMQTPFNFSASQPTSHSFGFLASLSVDGRRYLVIYYDYVYTVCKIRHKTAK